MYDMTYYFSVSNLYLTCLNSRKTIIADSREFHTARFIFDDEWLNMAKSVTFNNSKTGVSVLISALDVNDGCNIPYEALAGEGYLEVCVQGIDGTTSVFTRMVSPLLIEPSNKVNGSTPLPPTASVYEQIMTEFANRYVDAIYTSKKILTTDWQTATDIINITPTFTKTIVNGTTLTMRSGNLTDYLNRVSYAYTDFYLDYSTDGLTVNRIVASSESGTSPTLRKLEFIIGTNTYEVRITSTTITVRRTSGTTPYYIHSLNLRFDDYFYYDYAVTGLTPYYKGTIFVEDNSKQYLRNISFNQFPTFDSDTLRLIFSQKPDGDIETRFFGFKTDELLGMAEIVNIYGNAVFSNVHEGNISDLDTTQDNRIATVGQIKEYVNSLII